MEEQERLDADFSYSQDVGLVMYLAIGTQLDIVFSFKLASRFVSNLREVQVKVVKRILSYLCATTDIRLTFGKSNNQRLVGYADADYAGCTLSRRSTFVYIFLYGMAA